MSATGSDTDSISKDLKARTVMVIGATGTGKTVLCRGLADRLSAAGSRVGLVSADMGQPLAGPPTCLALTRAPLWEEASALWFAGDIAPVGNLLPTVVGTARLVERARSQGHDTIIIDTSGLVEGPVARVLKYHKLLAAGVDRVVAIQRDSELEETLRLLRGVCERVHVRAPAREATDRSASERRTYRQERYRAHFGDAVRQEFDSERLVGVDWAPVVSARIRSGTVVGLVDREGFCLGLGVVEELRRGRLVVLSPFEKRDLVAWIQLGKLRLHPRSGFSESR